MGPKLLKMSNNHLFSDIQCLIPFKILRLSKVAGLFCSNAQGWAMSDCLCGAGQVLSCAPWAAAARRGLGYTSGLEYALSSL